jgi:hypothetical protein
MIMGRLTERVVATATLGPYTFEEVEGHGFSSTPGSMWRFRIEDKRDNHTYYATLDHALASAVAERWTGPRGAGGAGVGTAADWFMAMIGASAVETVDELISETTEVMAKADPGVTHAVLDGMKMVRDKLTGDV